MRVNKFSLIQISGRTYSVPVQYIGRKLDAVIGCSQVMVYFEDSLVCVMPKTSFAPQINYLHMIDELVKKPGAFQNYKYRECLYPHPVFKQVCELLEQASVDNYAKEYLAVLHLAKHHGEAVVIQLLQEKLAMGAVVHFIQSGELKKQVKSVAVTQLPSLATEQLVALGLAKFDVLLRGQASCN